MTDAILEAMDDELDQDRLLRWFTFSNLPDESSRECGRSFLQLALAICLSVPCTPERTVALRKLLESRDSALRALQVPVATPTSIDR